MGVVLISNQIHISVNYFQNYPLSVGSTTQAVAALCSPAENERKRNQLGNVSYT
jgi:hypothetical protein